MSRTGSIHINRTASVEYTQPKRQGKKSDFPHDVRQVAKRGNGGNAPRNNDNIIDIRNYQRIPERDYGMGEVNLLNVSQGSASSDDMFQSNQLIDDIPMGDVRRSDLINDRPAFTIEQLREISDGEYNVGELKLKSDGTLDKINNHVHTFRWQNTDRLTPEQNLAVRRQVCKCIRDRYAGAQNLDTVTKLLLNERDRTSSLSRDEVNFLFKMLDGVDKNTYTVRNFKNLHDFKVGKLTDVSKVESFIKGIATAASNDKKDKDVADAVKAVSVNAQQGIVSVILNEILNFLKIMFTGMTSWRVQSIDDGLAHFANTGDLDRLVSQNNISPSSVERIFKEIKESYQFPANLRLPKNTVAKADYTNECKVDICSKIRTELHIVDRTATDFAEFPKATNAQRRTFLKAKRENEGEYRPVVRGEDHGKLEVEFVPTQGNSNQKPARLNPRAILHKDGSWGDRW